MIEASGNRLGHVADGVIKTDSKLPLADRLVQSPSDESAVRRASYTAMTQVVALSGKSMAAVDWFFFNARRRCPEMSVPECSVCQLDSVCGHHKEMFQPVLRTAFY